MSVAIEALPSIPRRHVVLGGALAAVAAGAAVLTPRRHQGFLRSASLVDMVPIRVGPWADTGGEGLILPESQGSASIYDKVVTRSYVARDLPAVMLLVAYGAAQGGLMQVHRPEVCFQSAGFRIDGDRSASVPLPGGAVIPAKVFTARREQRVEQVLYWTRISDQFPISLFSQRTAMLQAGLRGVVPDGLLVRMSVLGGDLAGAQAILKTFARCLVEAGGDAGRSFYAAEIRRADG